MIMKNLIYEKHLTLMSGVNSKKIDIISAPHMRNWWYEEMQLQLEFKSWKNKSISLPQQQIKSSHNEDY